MATNTEAQRAAYEAFIISDPTVTPEEKELWLAKDDAGKYTKPTINAGWACWRASHITTVEQVIELCRKSKVGGVNGQLATGYVATQLGELLES